MSKSVKYQGLSADEVLRSRKQHGANILTPPERVPLWRKFLAKFDDPLIRIIIVAGVLSVGIAIYEYYELGEAWTVFFEPMGIFVAVLLATGFSFYFEMVADKEFSILNKVNDDAPVKVFRDGMSVEIPKRDVVVGDIVILATGDEVPADAELLESITLSVDESSLTGEPICVKSANSEDADPEATFATNHVMRGTNVMEGHGICRVFAVGDNTENGKVYEAAQIDNSVRTPLNEQLDGLSRVITKLGYLFAAFVIIGKLQVFFDWHPLGFTLIVPTALFFVQVVKRFGEYSRRRCVAIIVGFFAVFMAMVIGIFVVLHPGEDFALLLAYTMQTLMIAVTLIVVAVPEGLPMAVTLSLAYSMRRMLNTNNLVRKMHACETMGATTVICTDKTGTLTRNRMTVYQTRFYELVEQTLGDDAASRLIVEAVATNSTATLDTSDEHNIRALGNPTEGALLMWLGEQGYDYDAVRAETPVVAQLPFSTERKYMATAVRSTTGATLLFIKGAPEIICSLSDAASVDRAVVDADLLRYQSQAMRTLGFAYRRIEGDVRDIDAESIARGGFTFMGIVAISDPVRDDVPGAVDECRRAGIMIKIVTGDTTATAVEIGRQIGLWSDADNEHNIITGVEFAKLSDEELDDVVLDLKIIARARPMDKKRLVESLMRCGHVVSVTGDGTNDAPALKAAHVGLSMGDGTSVAKEASDITIIDNSFGSICRAVMWGRSLYRNIQRFLLFQLTVNVAACLIVLIGAFMGVESPLTVTQMLWINLIMDSFGAMALASLPPTSDVMRDKPRDRNAFIINGSMAVNIFGMGIFFFVLTLFFLYIFQHADVTSIRDLWGLHLGERSHVTPYERTLLFSIFVWSHFWNMFNARSFMGGRSFFKLHHGKGFIAILCVIILGQIAIVELLYNFFNVQPMFHTADWHFNVSGFTDWMIIVLGASLVLWVREAWSFISRRINK